NPRLSSRRFTTGSHVAEHTGTHTSRVTGDVMPAEPQHGEAQPLQPAILGVVEPPLTDPVVEFGSVPFDDQARGPMEPVDAADVTLLICQFHLPFEAVDAFESPTPQHVELTLGRDVLPAAP